MKVAIGCDHAGYPLKQTVIEAIHKAGHEPLDLGTFSPTSVDFVDYAEKVGLAIQKGEAQRGILICGSGVGMGISANKMKGVYAATCHDIYSAHQGVEHDNMNVLCLGALVIGTQLARELVQAFLQAQLIPVNRYVERIEKLQALEERMENCD